MNNAQEMFLEEYLKDFVEENVVSAKAREIWRKYSVNKSYDGKWRVPTDPYIRGIVDAIEARAMREMSDRQVEEFDRLGRVRENRRKTRRRMIKKNPIPPKSIARVAKRGLAKRKKYRRGGTAVGVARARDLANRRNISKQTLGRMRSYFARHRASKAESAKRRSDPTSAAAIADDLWGGTAGMRWANSFR